MYKANAGKNGANESVEKKTTGQQLSEREQILRAMSAVYVMCGICTALVLFRRNEEKMWRTYRIQEKE